MTDMKVIRHLAQTARDGGGLSRRQWLAYGAALSSVDQWPGYAFERMELVRFMAEQMPIRWCLPVTSTPTGSMSCGSMIGKRRQPRWRPSS